MKPPSPGSTATRRTGARACASKLDNSGVIGFSCAVTQRILVPLGWILAGLALLLSFWLDFANAAQGGAIDLRNRITGLRLLEHGVDPYHYKWHEGDPEEFCDPFNNPNLAVSRTTATPALLLMHLPLAPLPYRVAQLLWLGAQWLLLIGTGWWWLRVCASSRQRWLAVLFVVGFSYTAAWRLHAERGQSYVLLAFAFAGWLSLTFDAKRTNGFAAGCLAGWLIALRPPFALLVPFLALHRRGQLGGAAIGLLAGLGLPMLWEGDCWLHYFAAMRTNAELNWTHFYPHYSQGYPPRIEGVPTDILAHYASIPFAEYSLPALWNWLGFAPLPDAVFLAAAVASFAFWLCAFRRLRAEDLLAGLAGWLFLADLFLPAYRNSYNDVLVLDIVAAGIVASTRFPWAAWPCALALPVGWAVYALAPEQAWLINLPSALFTLGAIVALVPVTFLFNNRAGSRKVAAAC